MSPDTPVATPTGERAIHELNVGDLVFSVARERIVAVPGLEVSSVIVPADHVMIRVTLASGRELAMSSGHPLADGRTARELRGGDRLGDAVVTSVESIAHGRPYTHDILPDSDSGVYFAAGAPVGSTLAQPATMCGRP